MLRVCTWLRHGSRLAGGGLFGRPAADRANVARRRGLDRVLALKSQHCHVVNNRLDWQGSAEPAILGVVRTERVPDELLPQEQKPLLVPRRGQRLPFRRIDIGAVVHTVADVTTNNAGRRPRADFKQLLPNWQGNTFTAPAMERNLYNHSSFRMETKREAINYIC